MREEKKMDVVALPIGYFYGVVFKLPQERMQRIKPGVMDSNEVRRIVLSIRRSYPGADISVITYSGEGVRRQGDTADVFAFTTQIAWSNGEFSGDFGHNSYSGLYWDRHQYAG